jgi:hypothetical protein
VKKPKNKSVKPKSNFIQAKKVAKNGIFVFPRLK